MLDAVVNFINDLMWGKVLIWLLIGCGLYFTLALKFIQFRHFGHMIGVLRESRNTGAAEANGKAGISPFQALSTSLAARVGTGNLAGVATAIAFGGPGAVFWMWLIALLGMATSFAESTLAQVYKVKDDEGNFRGGPSYYMEQGLGQRWMGVLFSIFLLIAFGLVFNAVQANTIAHSMEQAFGFDKLWVGVGVTVAAGLIIFGGLKKIARFAELVVPVMAIFYLLVALGVVIVNIGQLGDVFATIFAHAFGLREAGAGALGAAMAQGIKRGLFSNEAGMGSAPNVAASAVTRHPATQGYVQMLGVFMDTLVICTATAAMILISGAYEPESGVIGVQLTQLALDSQLPGNLGSVFVAVALLFFAFTSIVGNYTYAETNLVFLEHNHPHGMNIFRLCVLGMVMFGALAEVPVIWNMADASMGLMALVNIAALIMLSGVVVRVTRHYNHQLDAGLEPGFCRHDIPGLDKQLAPGIWEDDGK